MAVNPAIAMGVQPLQLTDPLTQYGRFAAIQQAQNQNALAQYQLGAARREEASQNALNEAYRAAYDPQTGAIDMNRLRQTLSTGGFGSKLPGIEKSMADMEEQRLKRDAAKTALADVKLKQARSFLDTIDPADPTAPEKFMAWHEANHRDPVLGPLLEARGVTADQSRGRIQQAIQQGPQAFAQLLLQSKVGTEKFMEMNKTPAPPVDVATMQALGFPLTPQGYAQYRDSQRQERMLSPEEEAQRIRIALASKPPAPPAAPREPPAPTVTQIQDPADPSRMLTIDARRYAGGSVGAPGVIGTSGKTAPAAAAEQKKIAAQNELQNVIDTLKTAYADLDAMRAVPSEQRNVISNALSYIASTGPGQVAGRIGGTAAQTQRDVIQSSRNLLFTAVKNATGKTSGELNSNVEFKTWLEALTDPSRSIQANQAILENLEKFVASGGNYSAKKGGGEVKPAPGAQAPAGFPAPPQGAIDALKRGQGTDAQFDAIFGPGAAARARRQ